MKVERADVFTPIIITIETAEERDELIGRLDADRNHPAIRQLYKSLIEHRHTDLTRGQQ